MWVYEGLAEYFSKNEDLKLTPQQINQYLSFSLGNSFPDYSANYRGGESVYRFMESGYGKEITKQFIAGTYSVSVEQAINNAFEKDINEIEREWKEGLEMNSN